MNKQVKINIKNKDYYCDMEVLKLIERLQDKVELLEYNRDQTLKNIDGYKKLFNLDLFSTALENIEDKLRGEE